MAPEVVQMKTYDTKCDVFSFAILLWEILALKQAFQGMDANAFVDKVIIQRQRLEINKKWPSLTRLALPEAWDDNPQKRPDMKRISKLILSDLNLMTTDETMLRRARMLQTRSEHSLSDESDIGEVQA
jgi:Protein tyrosine and serine/threonine kinase